MSTNNEQSAAGGTGNIGKDVGAANNNDNQQGDAQQNGRGNRGGRGGAGGNRASNFRGATAALSGKVFQLQTKQSSTTQFQDTWAALSPYNIVWRAFCVVQGSNIFAPGFDVFFKIAHIDLVSII